MQRFSILDKASFCPLFDKVWQWRDDDQDPATVSVLIQLFTQFSETVRIPIRRWFNAALLHDVVFTVVLGSCSFACFLSHILTPRIAQSGNTSWNRAANHVRCCYRSDKEGSQPT